MTDADKARSDKARDRFVTERIRRIKKAVEEVCYEYGKDDPFAEHMARGWNIMRASVRAARREASMIAQPVDHDLEEETHAGETLVRR